MVQPKPSKRGRDGAVRAASIMAIAALAAAIAVTPATAQIDVRAQAPDAVQALVLALVEGLDPSLMVGSVEGSKSPDLSGMRIAVSVRTTSQACRGTPEAGADAGEIAARVARVLRARGVDAETGEVVEQGVGGSAQTPTARVTVAYPHATGQDRLASSVNIEMPDGSRTNLTVSLDRRADEWGPASVAGPILISGPIYRC